VKFEVSKRASRQIERIQSWWSQHRADAAGLFVDELTLAEQRLRTSPELGTLYAAGPRASVRRLLLQTEHHLYYRYEAAHSRLVVLAVWGGPRGRGPRL
jgi:plasmid stabilization system protein ParE